ncbi:arginyltransferase [Roseiterribacter gracilis]|uniref:Aspartate/glutamate leucyltransferase n=1 Tax=Roseiterribacter gracilis TaxID=2812848 RepID=A0A8S8X990_9PROT|nr:putative arginyl-tRNA--protein transferase [Rhodospirillales bacterium TMPK1]
MSILLPSLAGLHRFHRSMPLPCPYLDGQTERKLFTRLVGDDSAALNSSLTRAGFRRSHDVLYRPICTACSACVPVRLLAKQLAPGRTHRRTEARNQDLVAHEMPSRADPELYRLFLAYQAERHPDGDMGRMRWAEFRAMLEEGADTARLLSLRDASGRLVGVMLFDRVDDGASAVYSFYAPNEPERSLGTYLILALARRIAAEKLDHLYLGYWIRGAAKMTYKIAFHPLEALGPNGWSPLEP